MRRWSRPIGLALSALAVIAVAVVAVVGGERPPDADLRNGRVFIQDNLWSTATHQYAVWVAPDGTPYVGRRARGGSDWDVVDLGRLRGNPLAAPTADDDHNVYALGVSDGEVHVAGNMHTSPLRYVRSDQDFQHGWSTAPAPRATDSVTYPAFVGLPDGTLLFFRRQGAVGTGAAVLLDALPPGGNSWHSLGTILDGRATDESPYLHHVAVDPDTGTIHLLFEWRGGATIQANDDVSYARSTDGGRTWETSRGERLALPITHATAETVIDTAPSGAGLLNSGGLTVDSEGRPHGVVVFDRPTGGHEIVHVWFDGSWRQESLGDLGLEGRPQLAGTRDGRVWLLGVAGTTVRAIDITPDRERLPSRDVADVTARWEVALDSQALAMDGSVEILVPDGDQPHVVEADLAP